MTTSATLLQTHDRPERRMLLAALAAAGLLHVAALFIPLPPPRAVPVVVPEPTPIQLTPWRPEPPPLQAPAPAADRTAIVRRIPMVVERSIDLDPIVETAPSIEPADPLSTEIAPVMPSPIAPPQTTGQVYLDGTPGLESPIPHAGRAEPDYPSPARQARVEGRVILTAVISADGNVDSIEVLRAPEPDLGFSRAAIEAVSSWTYDPARIDGRAVAVSMTVVVEFRLR